MPASPSMGVLLIPFICKLSIFLERVFWAQQSFCDWALAPDKVKLSVNAKETDMLAENRLHFELLNKAWVWFIWSKRSGAIGLYQL